MLNKEQQSAVNCTNRRILCLAGAGTGKTTTMLDKIQHVVNSGVDPRYILVLTFTNAAAFEMKERYIRKSNSRVVPEFRTFHSFCYSLILENTEIQIIMGYSSKPKVADDIQQKRILREAATITNIKLPLNKKSKDLSMKDKRDLEIVKKEADRLMMKYNLITFDRMCNYVCKLFKDGSPLVEKYIHKYKYIFVDEFQDTDATQYDFVKSFENANCFVVGDALQSIYGFRGADSSIIKKLASDPDWCTIKLTKNYRSSKNICEFANKYSRYASSSYRVAIEPGKDFEGNNVSVKHFVNDTTYSGLHPKAAKYCIADMKTQTGSTAILFRTNKEVAAMKDLLTEEGIPFRAQRKDADLRNLLVSIGDNEFMIEWISSHLPAEKYSEYIRICDSVNRDSGKYKLENFLNDFGSTYIVATLWNQVRDLRRICKDESYSVFDRCKMILNVLDCSYIQLEESRCTDMRSGVEHVVERFDGDTEAPLTDIYVGTIHSVKGLEFDNVYTLGVGEKSFNLDIEENKNLFYVAITRARKHLVICSKESI